MRSSLNRKRVPLPTRFGEFSLRLYGTRVDRDEHVALVVPPEGTHSGGRYGKSGFHRIAVAADVPIVLTYLDGPSRTGGWGPSFRPGASAATDMHRVREFYRDKRGLRPSRKTEPLLRSEEGTRQ